MKQAESDRDESSKKILKYSEALGKVESEMDDLKDQLSVWQQKGDVADANMAEARRQLKAMRAKMEEDGVVYMRRMKVAEDRVKELHNQLLQRGQELDASTDLVRKLRREYQSTRQDAEGMLQVMTGLERQLADFSSREEQVERIAKESKEKMEEAYLQRDQAVSREEQCKREIERLLEERKKQALNLQRDVDAAVAKVKSAAQAELASVERDLEEASGRAAAMKDEFERTITDNRECKDLIARLQRLLEEERASCSATIKEMEERMNALARGKEDELGRLRVCLETNRELRGKVDAIRNQTDSQRSLSEEREKLKEKEVVSMRAALRAAQQDAEEKQRELTRALNDLQALQSSIDESAISNEKRREDELATHRRKVTELEKNLRDFDLLIVAEGKRLKLLMDGQRERFQSDNSALQDRLREEREAVHRATARIRQLEQALSSVQAEKESLLHRAEAERSKAMRSKAELRRARSLISDLSNQLASSYEAREDI
eukprot:gene5074-6461_t